MKGPAVRRLQTALQRLGFLAPEQVAAEAGDYGARTQQGVRAFQADRGVPTTGEYDARTQAAMRELTTRGLRAVSSKDVDGFSAPEDAASARPGTETVVPDAAPAPTPPATTTTTVLPPALDLTRVPAGTAAQYAFFAQYVKANGGKFQTGRNQMNLVGFRQPTSTHADGGNGRYDDRLAAVWKDAHGRPQVRFFRFNAEPAADMRKYSDDVDRDGANEQGRIPEGFYKYALSTWKDGRLPCLRATSDFRVERDMNQDGRFDENRRTGGGATMLFHEGGPDSSGTWSAGCQTFDPGEWDRFWGTVRGARGNIGYTLVQGLLPGLP